VNHHRRFLALATSERREGDSSRLEREKSRLEKVAVLFSHKHVSSSYKMDALQNDGDATISSPMFHHQTFGKNIRLEDGATTAIRFQSFDHG
jgi:hypothetical protein